VVVLYREVHEPGSLDVEFVTASGCTQAVVTLTEQDVRPVADEDLISARHVERGAA